MGTGGTSPSLPPVRVFEGLRPLFFHLSVTRIWDLGLLYATLTTAQIGFNTSDLTIDLIVSLNVVSFDSSFGFVLSSA